MYKKYVKQVNNFLEYEVSSECTHEVDTELLKECLTQQAESAIEEQEFAVQEFVLNKLEEWNIPVEVERDDFGNMYITKTTTHDLYIGVVGHVDGVHDYNEYKTVFHHGNFMFAMDISNYEQIGTQGDDLTGVYLVLELLRKYPNVKGFLPVQEENGTCGSNASDITFWSDTSFVIQADRNHYKNDFITFTNGVDCTSKEFDLAVKPYLDLYDYQFATGTITDVGELKCKGMNVCTFNIAAGYLEAHTDQEVVDIRRLKNSLNLVYTLIDNLSDKVWQHKSSRPVYSSGYYGGWENWDSRTYEDGYDEEKYDASLNYDMLLCPNCDIECDAEIDGIVYCSGCSTYLHIPENMLDGITIEEFNAI